MSMISRVFGNSIILLCTLGIVSSYAAPDDTAKDKYKKEKFSYKVDPSLAEEKDGVVLEAVVGPTGLIEKFAQNEILLLIQNRQEIQKFQVEFPSTIVSDGRVGSFSVKGLERKQRKIPDWPRVYTVNVDPNGANLQHFKKDMEQLGYHGAY